MVFHLPPPLSCPRQGSRNRVFIGSSDVAGIEMTTSRKTKTPRSAQIRYAVAGVGHIAQVAVLPAIAHAASNSQLTTLVSGDPQKLKDLSRRDHVPYTYSYEQ